MRSSQRLSRVESTVGVAKFFWAQRRCGLETRHECHER